MSRYSPSVLPEYSGGNIGDKIALALQQKQAFDRQRDLDAVETGVGLQRGDTVSTDAPVSFGDRIKQAYQRVTGQGQQATPDQIQATRSGLNTLASNQASANNGFVDGRLAPQFDSRGMMDGKPGYAPGTYTPQGIPQTLRLPSGQTVETQFTPFGQRLQQAELQRQYNMAMLGERLGTQRELAGVASADRRYGVDARSGDVDRRIAAQQTEHSTMTPFQSWRTQHPLPTNSTGGTPRPLANAPGSVGALTHVVAADRASVADLNNTMNAARKNPPSGKAILRSNPQADTTAVLNRFRADTTATRGALDAARGRLQQHTADLGQAGAGGSVAPAPLRALTSQEQAAAKSDPGFARFLSQKGYTAGQDY